MNTKDFVNRIGGLIGKDELQKAINELSMFLKNSTKFDEVIIQSARYNDVIRDVRRGTIKLDDANVTKNQIRYALLDITREIEEVVEKDETYLTEADDTLKQIFSSNEEKSQNIGIANYGGEVNIKAEDISFGNMKKIKK